VPGQISLAFVFIAFHKTTHTHTHWGATNSALVFVGPKRRAPIALLLLLLLLLFWSRAGGSERERERAGEERERYNGLASEF